MLSDKKIIARLLLFSFCFAQVMPAFGQEKTTRVAVVGFRSESHPSEAKTRLELKRKLAESAQISLVDESSIRALTTRLWRSEAEQSVSQIREARKSFIEGKKLYDNLALEQSIRQFSQAVSGYREGVGALKDNRYLLVSHLYLGMALIVLGKITEGEKYIREMIILDANRENRALSKKEFPPQIIDIHQRLSKEVMSGSFGEVNITVRPSDTRLYVNGLLQKENGSQKLRLPVGEHFLVFERKGYRQQARAIQVKAEEKKEKIAMEEWRPLSPYSLEKRNNLIALEDLNRITQELGAEVLVLGDVYNLTAKNKLMYSAQIFDARSQEFSKIQTVTVSTDRFSQASRPLARKVSNQITPQGYVVADIRSAPIMKPTIDVSNASEADTSRRASSERADRTMYRKPIYKRTGFLVGVGLLVAGGVAAALLGQPDNSGNTLVINTDF